MQVERKMKRQIRLQKKQQQWYLDTTNRLQFRYLKSNEFQITEKWMMYLNTKLRRIEQGIEEWELSYNSNGQYEVKLSRC